MASAVVFAYHDVGVRCLATLLGHGVDVRLVVTHEDNPAETIWFASVRRLAQERGIPVITPADANDHEVVDRVAACAPDFLFSFYYRSMLKAPLLSIPRRGAYNMHGSLLPKYRGRVPINWAIIKGETETGATLHQMNVKPDNGPLVDHTRVPIFPDDTAAEVFSKVVTAAELTLDRCLPSLIDGSAVLQQQDLSQGAYFGGRTAADGRIDWTGSARDIHNLVRAVTRPYPGAWSDTDAGRLIVWRTRRSELLDSGPAALLLREGQLLARCGDRHMLVILDAELDGVRLDENHELLSGHSAGTLLPL